MPLLVEQLIYTSFPKIGFKCLVSEQVPLAIQQAFCEQVVHNYWDTYNPPEVGYRAAYLCQISYNQVIFGWLYNDGADDFGRANIPYFIGYYLPETLNSFQLDKIFTCLETGPVNLIDRRYPPDSIENLLIPDFCLYEAPRRGVVISPEVRQESHSSLEKKILVNLFVMAEKTTLTQPRTSSTEQTNGQKAPTQDTVLDLPPESEPASFNSNHRFYATTEVNVMPIPVAPPSSSIPPQTSQIDIILREFAAKPIGIQGAVLVSVEGYPVTSPIGIDHNSSLIMAGTMLYLAKSTQEEFNWQQVEHISVRGQQGHVILAACNAEVFLLVKAGKAVTGLLEGEINRTVKKLQSCLQMSENIRLAQTSQSQPLPELTTKIQPAKEEVIPVNSPNSNHQFIYEIASESLIDAEQEVRYRGRKTN
jgi:predicted regulator of Ras-like GTPase activity (Roadblock/LC7/MglB family)